jgi:spore germination protein GerM
VAPDAESSGDTQPQDDASITPLARRSVEIYFASLLEDGLVGEFREIFDTATPGDQIKQIVADLISGPTTDEATWVIPGGARLRQAYVLDNGTAWLDFSSELTDGIGGGSMNELLTVYAIVNSVVINVQQVSRVGILVGGRPVQSLNGHLHLLNPLRPNFALILGSITVKGPSAPLPERYAAAVIGPSAQD